MPKVSIVLPVYNHKKYLQLSIDSILSQTVQDFELIIVNDGSTEDLTPILNKYKNNEKVKIITHEKNRRLPAALNTGFANATGEYYTWTSSDNICLPNWLEVLNKYLDNNPDKGMAYSNYIAIDGNGNNLNNPAFRHQNKHDKNNRHIMFLPTKVTKDNLHKGDNFIGASFMYRAQVAKVVGEYEEQFFGGEDYDYWLRLHDCFDIGHVPQVLYKYRVHQDTLNARAREFDIYTTNDKLLQRDYYRRKFMKEYGAKIGKIKAYQTFQDIVSKKIINLAVQMENIDKGGMEQNVSDFLRLIKDKVDKLIVICVNSIGEIGEALQQEGFTVYCVKQNLPK